MAARVGIAWYFHLPIIASDIEVRDHVRSSLQPMLRLHREQNAPFLLAPTGGFLLHCERCEPTVLSELRSEIEVGRVRIAATYMYETDPLSVPWASLIAHIGQDVELKRRLLGVHTEWLLAPNFVWRPGMERILARFDIAGVILDSRQLAAATKARSWRWDVDADGEVRTLDVPSRIEPWEHRRLRILAADPAHNAPRIAFRDWPLTRSLTFGNDGAIHVREPVPAIQQALHAAALGEDELTIVADDGDRIRGTSYAAYRRLLGKLGPTVDWARLIDEPPTTPPLRELGAFSPPGIDALLRASEDARFYWSLLEELRGFAWSPAERAEQLALDDVFYPFWPGVGRRKWYVDRALAWIERGIERGTPGLHIDTDGDPHGDRRHLPSSLSVEPHRSRRGAL
ncbi:MAG TPA: hypothetical protein VG147_09595 [Solirubrobacteraceae bacterium]|nr:hypothetical protein [Solirubrobacteraceae bacterium]